MEKNQHQPDMTKEAFVAAAKILARQPRTEKEIRQKLIDKDFPAVVVSLVVSRLRQDGYLDDTHYARDFIEQTLRYRPAGRYLLLKKLQARGITNEVATKALEECYPPDKEAEIGERLLVKKLKDCKYDNKQEKAEKLVSYLKTKGLATDIIMELLERHGLLGD